MFCLKGKRNGHWVLASIWNTWCLVQLLRKCISYRNFCLLWKKKVTQEVSNFTLWYLVEDQIHGRWILVTRAAAGEPRREPGFFFSCLFMCTFLSAIVMHQTHHKENKIDEDTIHTKEHEQASAWLEQASGPSSRPLPLRDTNALGLISTPYLKLLSKTSCQHPNRQEQ